ncbi:hypothetical protein CCUG60884_01231 [Mycobacteroides salmoniphilum]|uniref:Uncharacterized protein n=1 Tax=Mycobacteroides salmoniphilum TaxID=404941 RepID=A0A4R8SUV6_9MYCO|nr:hypothetical protein CCUG60884_01231 [Mycobacteroides salmoniphilum]
MVSVQDERAVTGSDRRKNVVVCTRPKLGSQRLLILNTKDTLPTVIWYFPKTNAVALAIALQSLACALPRTGKSGGRFSRAHPSRVREALLWLVGADLEVQSIRMASHDVREVVQRFSDPRVRGVPQ